MATKAQVEAALTTLVVDQGLMHDIIHGGSTDPDVVTEGGNVPPLAKKIASLAAGQVLNTTTGLTQILTTTGVVGDEIININNA
jgi:hypothetical protein